MVTVRPPTRPLSTPFSGIRDLVMAGTAFAVGTAMFAEAWSQAKPATGVHVMVAPEAIKWQPIPPDWADGPPPPGYALGHSEIAIMDGDPAFDARMEDSGAENQQESLSGSEAFLTCA